MRWNREDVAALHRYAVSGMSLRDTAQILGRPVNEILNKMITERIGFIGAAGEPARNGRLAPATPPFREHSVYHPKVGFCRACGIKVDDVVSHYREAHRPSQR